MQLAGSSPLARGILYVDMLSIRGGGIIPARAGNIYVPLPDHHPGGDHPRSRGEYYRNYKVLKDDGGIIHARAGNMDNGQFNC